MEAGLVAWRTGGRGRTSQAFLACAALKGVAALAPLPSAWVGLSGGPIGSQFGPRSPCGSPVIPTAIAGLLAGARGRAAWLWSGRLGPAFERLA
ncbi:hypothetical protein NDU88_000721 [Pleurodeles waltl]|uniref:Uncharacterized protein n=1 Tax=Pleurodeles waltl TaxID=8319 RepID=A0AAV7S9G6_PLEWA|nr:hypothetical protein NDU88_000721 [Pleurodeles waltl]